MYLSISWRRDGEWGAVREMESAEQARYTWSKARASQPFGMCVEVAALPDGVGVRHSSTPGDGVLVFSRAEFAAFVDGVKRGEFDHLA